MKKFLQFAALCALTLGLAASCGPDDVNPAETLNTPTGLTVGTLTPTTAALSWTAVEGAEKYNVVLDDGMPVEVYTSSYKAEGLTPETTYRWKIQALKSSAASTWADGGDFTTPAEGNKTPDPTGLTVTGITNSKATLMWQHADADFHEVRLNGGEAINVSTPAYQAVGLTAETTYTWEVRSSKNDVWSNWVQGEDFTTVSAMEGAEFPYIFGASYFGSETFGDRTSHFGIAFSTFDRHSSDLNGLYLGLNIVAEPVDESSDILYLSLPEGIYNFDDTKVSYSVCLSEPNTGFQDCSDGNFTVNPAMAITGGTMNVKRDGSIYTLKFNLTLAGDTFIGYYTGPLIFRNPQYVTQGFAGDQNFGNLPISALKYFDNFAFINGGEGDIHLIQAMSSGISYTGDPFRQRGTYSGNGWAIPSNLQIHNTSDSGPAGIYNITEPLSDDGNAPGTVLGGFGSLAIGDYTGLWLFQLEGDAIIHAAPIIGGTVTVSYSGNNYAIAINGRDDNGNNITGTVTGPTMPTHFWP